MKLLNIKKNMFDERHLVSPLGFEGRLEERQGKPQLISERSSNKHFSIMFA